MGQYGLVRDGVINRAPTPLVVFWLSGGTGYKSSPYAIGGTFGHWVRGFINGTPTPFPAWFFVKMRVLYPIRY
jgi:hypothetical protein